MHRVLATSLLALAFAGAPAFAQGTSAAPAASAAAAAEVPRFAAPASFAAAPEPKPEDTNALRAKTQPYNNAPLWRGVHNSGTEPGVVNLPGVEKGVLIQPFVRYPGSRMTNAGEAWREVRNGWIIPYGGSLILIAVVAMALLYFTKGPLGQATNTGVRRIERFTPFERSAHWLNAIAFVVLGVSGIAMAFGKFFLLPLIGHSLFGWLTYALKTLHNFFGPLFAVTLLVVIVTFIRDNLPRRGDLAWFKSLGGLRGHEAPSHRFNAGQKVIFWGGALLLGVVVVGSGIFLDKLIPDLAYLRSDMQVAHMIHAVATALLITVFLFHIYVGTIGMRGAYRAMREGYVDDAWAREHHALWHEDIEAGRVPAQRSREPAPGTPAAQKA